MKYTELLLSNELYREMMKEIERCEADRIYCKHDLNHALDVCRIAWEMYQADLLVTGTAAQFMERERDHFYVTGLLHDIGRAKQYTNGEHHSEAGKGLAEQILNQIGYHPMKTAEVVRIIGAHHGRGELPEDTDNMEYYIRKADHISRKCFWCEAADSCKWKEEERNATIIY